MTIGAGDGASSSNGPGNLAAPSVSVVVPTHGRPALLRSAVRSIVDQEYPGEIEVLVVFDREDPSSPEVPVREGRTVRLLTNDRTPGQAGARNVGALAAAGRYLAFCDDDDEWMPGKLRLQVDALERRPEAQFATAGILLQDDAGEVKPRPRVAAKAVLSTVDLLRTPRTALHQSTYVLRREEALRDVGLLDEAIPAGYGEDYDWLVRASGVAPVLVVRRPLVRVRWRTSYFAERWDTVVEALEYQLAHRPELARERSNLARIHGRLAFGHAALGHRSDALRNARTSARLDPFQLRAYAACLVAWGVVRATTVQRALHRFGRSV
jgi:glycosyltransferase involved in cell wall biosynthesis